MCNHCELREPIYVEECSDNIRNARVSHYHKIEGNGLEAKVWLDDEQSEPGFIDIPAVYCLRCGTRLPHWLNPNRLILLLKRTIGERHPNLSYKGKGAIVYGDGKEIPEPSFYALSVQRYLGDEVEGISYDEETDYFIVTFVEHRQIKLPADLSSEV